MRGGSSHALKQFRTKYHLTQKELAQILGTTPTTLSHYENGRWHLDQSVIDTIKERYGETIRPVAHATPVRHRSPKQTKVWGKAD